MLRFIAAINDIGAFIGAVIAAVFGMKLGRRWTIVIGCILVTIGAAIQASAVSRGQMLAGRIIAVSLLVSLRMCSPLTPS